MPLEQVKNSLQTAWTTVKTKAEEYQKPLLAGAATVATVAAAVVIHRNAAAMKAFVGNIDIKGTLSHLFNRKAVVVAVATTAAASVKEVAADVDLDKFATVVDPCLDPETMQAVQDMFGHMGQFVS
ncbi:MAG: hypothetical protein HY069_00895 [Chlamydiia bacterium]|nr:hypothetical protein [Chlamydiia bacterium]